MLSEDGTRGDLENDFTSFGAKSQSKGCIFWSTDSVEGLEKGSKAALSPWKNYLDVVEVWSSTSLFESPFSA